MEQYAVAGESDLRAAGKRITPQRKLVLDILAQADGHLDAGDIYARGRQQDARLSLATVYRTLSLLKEAGMVRELHLSDEHHHYELDNKAEHVHLLCLQCGQVTEVEGAVFTEAVTGATEGHGFTVTGVDVELTGICADCQQE